MNDLRLSPFSQDLGPQYASHPAQIDLWIIEELRKEQRKKKKEPLELPRLNPPELLPPSEPEPIAQQEEKKDSRVIVFDI